MIVNFMGLWREEELNAKVGNIYARDIEVEEICAYNCEIDLDLIPYKGSKRCEGPM